MTNTAFRPPIGRTAGLALLMLGLSATAASAQADRGGAPEPRFTVEGAAGAQISYTGHAESLGFGFSPTRSLTLLITAHRSFINDEITVYPDGYSAFRGGTEQYVSAEVRYAFLPYKRVSPYVLGGRGRGVSRPTVNSYFPDRKERTIEVFYWGGGVRIPIQRRLDAFVDARLIMTGEGKSDYFGVHMPVRAGVAFRF